MLLKTIIIVLLIGLLISLGSGLVFLFKDVGSTRRTLHSLGVRITLAVALMATTVYGFLSGQLEIGAPWDARKFTNTSSAPQSTNAGPGTQLDDVNKEE
ncbi:MAG: DUF2909 domain-containing protein [Pseudomonadales bacterium]|nr:DUF2909 domain-containing protein [Gammaproteobacteria bacterium]NNL57607.1 DUF2909 domain-containing protein [Pseudomonadales bacterium]